jgi:DNA-binding NarL/FixJ family response regulator
MDHRKITPMPETAPVPGPVVRVLVVEDHGPYREFVLSIVKIRPEFQVIAQVADGAEAVRCAKEFRPDLILLDIGLPGLNGIEAARRISLLSPDSRILFVSQESSEEVVLAALGAGAMGYVLKLDAGRDLMAAVNSVLRGDKFISRSIKAAGLIRHPALRMARSHGSIGS